MVLVERSRCEPGRLALQGQCALRLRAGRRGDYYLRQNPDSTAKPVC